MLAVSDMDTVFFTIKMPGLGMFAFHLAPNRHFLVKCDVRRKKDLITGAYNGIFGVSSGVDTCAWTYAVYC